MPMDFAATLIIILLIVTNTAFCLAAVIFYKRWRRGQRLAVLSEQSRASRVRSETARQVIKGQHFFISRYVRYLEAPTKDINELTEKISQSKDINSAHAAASRLEARSRLLLKSIANLKDFADLELGELTLRQAPVSSRQLLEEAISTMRTFFASGHQHLLLDISSWHEQTIIVDKDKFCAMLGHLAHGIASYLPEGCTINFTAEAIRSGEGRVVTWLQISDSVTDFDLPESEHLFDPLGAALVSHANIEVEGQMPSLELPFAKHLAELMGGSLNFRRVGTGHAVEIELFFNVGE